MSELVKRKNFLIVLFVVIIYQLLCIVQGFDLSDEGWAMYFYQQIFKNPETVGAQMPYWFTGIIGGLWYKLFPTGGFFLMRLFGVFIVTSTFCISYNYLKKFLNPSILLLGLAAQILIVAGDPKPFGYNSLSAFLIIITVVLFFNGMEKRKLFLLFSGGFLLGINIFVRIPNIASLVILLLIPTYIYLKEKRFSIINRYFFVGVLGVVVAVISTVIVMKMLGHWNLFVNSLTAVANSASDKANSHQFGTMFFQYLKNYLGILKVGIFCMLIGIIYAGLKKLFHSSCYQYFLVLLTAAVIAYYSVKCNRALRENDMFFVHFISYFSIALIYMNVKETRYSLKFAAFAAFLMVVFIPLGSDRGIVTIWTSSWLSLPLGIAYIYSQLKGIRITIKDWTLSIDKKTLVEFCGIVYTVYMLTGIYKNDCCAYYDPGTRFEKVHAINNPYCRFIYTNSYRAKLMNELLPALSNFVKPGDYLLAYESIPGINYMTDTDSYVPNAWLWCYSGEELEKQINKSIREKKTFPIVLRQHFVAINRWREFDPNFFNKDNPDISYSESKRIQVINHFLSENNYRTVWTNNYFDILLSEKTVHSKSDNIK